MKQRLIATALMRATGSFNPFPERVRSPARRLVVNITPDAAARHERDEWNRRVEAERKAKKAAKAARRADRGRKA